MIPLCFEYLLFGFYQLGLGGSKGSRTKYQVDKRSVSNMRRRWLQVPGDFFGYIQDRVMGLEDLFSLTGYYQDMISAGRYKVTGVSWVILQ